MKYLVIIWCALLVGSCDAINETSEVLNPIELPTKSFTLWSDTTELFVEFPALVVGRPVRFAAHFTVLKGHQPVREGQVRLSLVKEGKGIRTREASPSSPGIFSPSLQPKEAGNYQLIFELETPGLKDQHIIQDVIVYESEASAIEALSHISENGGIPFLKEQAWKLEFQTVPAQKKEVFEAIPTFGIWEAVTNKLRNVSAKSSGAVNFEKELTLGTFVRKGSLVMTLNGNGYIKNNLSAVVQKAKTHLEQQEAQYLRKQELFAAQIISKSEWEEVQRDYQLAKQEYRHLNEGVSAGKKQILAPQDGYIQSLNVQNGAFVAEGSVLFSVTDSKSSVLKLQVSSQYHQDLEHIQNIWYKTPLDTWQDIKSLKGEVWSVDKTVSPDKPMLWVFAKTHQPYPTTVGSMTEAVISVGAAHSGIVIPKSALLEEYGTFSVIVQLSGERFEKRSIQVGKRNGNDVEVLSGIQAGEMLVSKGAYQVKIAAMSGQAPAHGHAH